MEVTVQRSDPALNDDCGAHSARPPVPDWDLQGACITCRPKHMERLLIGRDLAFPTRSHFQMMENCYFYSKGYLSDKQICMWTTKK